MKKLILVTAITLLIGGCSTSKEEMFPHNEQTMLDIWNAGSGSNNLFQERGKLLRPLSPDIISEELINHTRTAQNEIYNQFKRLPNPDLVMFVFPHLTKGETESVPVPGYSTVFPFYNKVQYAMPGENVGDL